MYFDKARNLNSYNIKAVIRQDATLLYYDNTKSGANRCLRSSRIVCAILEHLNADLTVKQSNSRGFIDQDGKPQGELKDVLTSTVDLSLTSHFMRDYWKQQTHPFSFGALKVLSLKESTTYNGGIIFIVIIKVWLFLIISCFACAATLAHILGLPVSMAALEFLRLVTGAANLKPPRNSSGRITLLILTCYAFLVGSVIQSWLSAKSTEGYRSPSIDSLEELIQSKLQVYGMPSHEEFITEKDIRNRYHYVNYFTECATERLLKGERVACLHFDSHLKIYHNESAAVHVSRRNLVERGLVYVYADDFPLLSKINWILLKLKEGGFIELLYNRYEYRETDKDVVGGVAMKDLAVHFHILLISWLLAILIFFVELVIFNTSQKLTQIIKSFST